MLKILFSCLGNSKSWLIMLIFLSLSQGLKINTLTNENIKLKYEKEKYQTLFLDYENKLKPKPYLLNRQSKENKRLLKMKKNVRKL